MAAINALLFNERTTEQTNKEKGRKLCFVNARFTMTVISRRGEREREREKKKKKKLEEEGEEEEGKKPEKKKTTTATTTTTTTIRTNKQTTVYV